MFSRALPFIFFCAAKLWFLSASGSGLEAGTSICEYCSTQKSSSVRDLNQFTTKLTDFTGDYKKSPEPDTAASDWVGIRDPANPNETLYLNEGMRLTFPLMMTDSDLALISASTTAVIVAFTSEKAMLEFVQKNKGHIANRAAEFGAAFGEAPPYLVVGAGYIYAIITDNEKIKDFATITVKAAFVTGLVNDAIKLGVRRALPSHTSDPFAIGKSYVPTDLAFPSSHTSAAFSLATSIAETTRHHSTIIPVLAYGAATVTAWSRVYQNQHWVSDVIAGALLGHLVTKAVMSQGRSEKNLEIVPYAARNSAGINIIYRGKVPGGKRLCGKNLEGASRIEACFRAAFDNK